MIDLAAKETASLPLECGEVEHLLGAHQANCDLNDAKRLHGTPPDSAQPTGENSIAAAGANHGSSQ